MLAFSFLFAMVDRFSMETFSEYQLIEVLRDRNSTPSTEQLALD